MVNRVAAGAAVRSKRRHTPPLRRSPRERALPTDTTPAPEPRFSIVEESAKPRIDWKIWFPFAILVLIALIGMFLVNMFVENERDQAKTEWRTRMGIVADSRTADVNRWFDEQFGDLQGIELLVEPAIHVGGAAVGDDAHA